jgi:putative ABC transport system ATP-binding protein
MSEVASVDDLVKNYQMEEVVVPALRGVSLAFEEGDFIALMGPSGSGKSTLLNLLGCLDRSSGGQYYLGGEDVSGMEDDQLSEVRSRYIGFIFQSYNLLPQYTVVENIEIPLLYQGCRLDDQTRQRCIALAEMVGLGDRLDHRPTQLSGGQQQRVAIARSLVNDPHIILADEPTGNLDSHTSDEIMRLLCKLNQAGKTIIMVTHENDIAAWARRVVRMRDGHIESDVRNDQATSATAATDRGRSSSRIDANGPRAEGRLSYRARRGSGCAADGSVAQRRGPQRAGSAGRSRPHRAHRPPGGSPAVGGGQQQSGRQIRVGLGVRLLLGDLHLSLGQDPQRVHPGFAQSLVAQAARRPVGAGHHHRHRGGDFSDGVRQGEHGGRPGGHSQPGNHQRHRQKRQARR